MPAWFETAIPLYRKLLSDSECLHNFILLIEPVIKNQFEVWAESGKTIPLFESISDLTSTAMLRMFLGPNFTKRHAKELVKMIRSYEKALQKPEVKLLPRWASKSGRLLIAIERRFETLVKEEMKHRLQNLDNCKDNVDYLQKLLDAVGDTYSDGVTQVFL
jgi:hypothetical protein